jgi:hypothetical protein
MTWKWSKPMGWNGSGVVIRETPVASGTVAWADTKAAGDDIITTTDHDFHDQNLADAIQNTIAKDGQNTPTANLPMGGYRHTGAADGVAGGDYATMRQNTGRLIAIQTFATSGTYTPTAGATAARFRWCGGGGGGGGVNATNGTQAAAANGGNGGAYCEALVLSGLTSQTITIGAGGSGGAAGFNFGSSGGNTVIGTIGTAIGGAGGAAGGAGAPPYYNTGQANQGGGAPTPPIYLDRGCELGVYGLALALSFAAGGTGGGTPFSAGIKGQAQPNSGYYGCGGGGAAATASGSAQAGKNGIGGYVIIEEYS